MPTSTDRIASRGRCKTGALNLMPQGTLAGIGYSWGPLIITLCNIRLTNHSSTRGCPSYRSLICLPFLSAQNFNTKASWRFHYHMVHGVSKILDIQCGNDNSAGSPTVKTFWLHLPLNYKVWKSSHVQVTMKLPGHNLEASPDHLISGCGGQCVKSSGT